MPAFFYLLLPVLFWSGNYVLGRITLGTGLDPFFLSFARWTLACLIILPFAYKNLLKEYKTILIHWKIITFFAWFGICNYNLFLYIGLTTTSVTNAVLLNSVVPVIILIAARVLLGQRTTWLQNTGIIISTLGVVNIVSQGRLDTLLNLSISTGDLWIIAAALCWAIYSVLIAKKPKNLSMLGFFASTAIIGMLIQIPITILFSKQDISNITSTDMGVILYMSVFASIGAFLCWNTGIQKLGAATAGQFIHLMPVFSIFLSLIFLNERLYSFHIIGIIFIFGGIFIATILNKVKTKRVREKQPS
ncbi:DMT family transporter [Marinomonas algicola]|uniref:DMT family transporter n=1 Tax=Marinomonas algicola TaxID=2773454 RepID=UPI00174A3575|nr:DMT family transporter [Marinomonas algicola]